MKNCRTGIVFAATVALMASLAAGQNAGNNTAYNGTSSITGSQAWIDASAFSTTSLTVCETIYNILTSATGYGTYPSKGAVVDARGLTSSNANLTCKASPSIDSPWYNGTTYADEPSVILLPAGTIDISYTWVLPGNTRLVGQGAITPVTSGTQTGTVIVAASNFSGYTYSPTAPLTMIQYGDPGIQATTSCASGICFNISVEDLTLSTSGSTQTIDGILNMDSQELTYARRVNFYGITGTGLQVGTPNYYTKSQNSGPYEQLYYSSTAGHCAQIYGAPTRGIHSINCTNTGTLISGGGILLDSTSNSIEDVYVTGFSDGILVGSASSSRSRPWSNVFSNINGGGTSMNLIHLCGATTSGNCTSAAVAAQDITILGATSTGGTTIQDDVTGTGLPFSTDPTVGMYALGEPVLISGTTIFANSRFTTSPTVPAWYIGSTQSPSGSCSNGSIYSATGTGGTGTLWGCISNGTTSSWVNLK